MTECGSAQKWPILNLSVSPHLSAPTSENAPFLQSTHTRIRFLALKKKTCRKKCRPGVDSFSLSAFGLIQIWNFTMDIGSGQKTTCLINHIIVWGSRLDSVVLQSGLPAKLSINQAFSRAYPCLCVLGSPRQNTHAFLCSF